MKLGELLMNKYGKKEKKNKKKAKKGYWILYC